ncbi:MAG: methyltransferase domain-containing protein [Armatimonadota bacterium]|nr:methyltransferase domain-containing protein [Armatimonadota bacterium]
MRHKFDPRNASGLENPERLRIQNPALVIRHLHVSEGMHVADVGAGTGFFTLPLADVVGPRGRVYALDVSPQMLEHLRARLDGRTQVVILRSEESRLPLPDSSVDRVLLANVFHELEDAPSMAREVVRILRPGGRVAVLDWAKRAAKSEGEPGPPMEHRVDAHQAAAALRAAGIDAFVVHEPSFPYHHLVIGTHSG